MPTQNLLVSGADVYDEKLVNPALFGPYNNGGADLPPSFFLFS